MKALLLLPCVCLLASCGSTPNPSAALPPPTVPRLVEVARPSTGVAAPLVRENSRVLAEVRSANEQLQATVEKARGTNASLGSLLATSIGDGQATRERLLEIEVLANRERDINLTLRIAVEKQASTVAALQVNAEKLEEEVNVLGAVIAVANQRLTDTSDQLTAANGRIESMTDAYNAAVGNATAWKAEADTAQGRIDTEKEWKWRFFWWAIGATVLVAAYVALRLHPATRAFIP